MVFRAKIGSGDLTGRVYLNVPHIWRRAWQKINVGVSGKNHSLRLHITGRDVEFPRRMSAKERVPFRLEIEIMKKLLILSILAIFVAGSVGCCRHRVRNWWHRGAICTPPIITNMNSGCCIEDCTTGCDETGTYYSNYSDGTLPDPNGMQDENRPGPGSENGA